MPARVATIVLAAGGSRRMGHAKQLVDVGGVPLVARVVRACVALGAGPVAVVVGAHAHEVAAAARAAAAVAIVDNPRWADGLASSLRAGVAWAAAADSDAAEDAAVIVALGDQPLLDASHLAALVAAWHGGAAIAASRYGDTLGAPALFARAHWAALAALEGDQGAGRLVRSAAASGAAVASIDWPDGALDVDTPADLEAVRARV